MAPRNVEQGDADAVRLAALGWIGPTGGFTHDRDGPGTAPYEW